ncbi:hypothetical protein AYO44_02070 [Planctomycetaceae bacterium SCGC AG-212-F19]|nr:hypothetical protein AYO44_02070 [Planctomycetaceae bacterium SCGC AG-212-F19]
MASANMADDLFAQWIGRAAPATPLATAATLQETLRQLQLLTADQLHELGGLPGKAGDPRQLGKDLLQRGWLTAYQVNMLLQGHGADLIFGPYLLLERLGEGGTGQVFKARHVRMQRVVALKVIRRELVADAETVARFYRETQVISRLAHPNLVHAYDAGPIGATHFLAMEYVEGTDLARLVKEQGPLSVGQACDYLRQAALGLQHIHENGLVHRDIKPSNLMAVKAHGAQSGDVIKLLDLGLARLQEQVHGKSATRLPGGQAITTLTLAGPVTIGTVDYLSPEQALDFHTVDIRADIYSLGCSFYYLLTGQPPFPRGTLAQKLLKHQQADPPSLASVRPELPAALEPLVKRMLAKRPEARFAAPADLVATLQALPHIKPATAIVSSNPGRATTVRPARKRWLGLGAGVALLVVGLLLAFLTLPAAQRGSPSRNTAMVQAAPQPPDTKARPRASLPAPTAVPGTLPSSAQLAEKVIRGRPLVRDAVIDSSQPDRNFGAVPKNNQLVRSDRTTVFLVYFDVAGAGVTPRFKVARAVLKFYVWDPHDSARTRVNVHALKTAWTEATVTWRQPAESQRWQGGDTFQVAADCHGPSSSVVVAPDPVNDTVDPPVEYQVDVTAHWRLWTVGNHPNHGLALVPVADRQVDDGRHSRFQMYASKDTRVQYTPTLVLYLTRD